MENKIMLIAKGNISEDDKQALIRAGVVIAEVKDINAVKIIAGTDYFDLDDIALSAFIAGADWQFKSNSDTLREAAEKVVTGELPYHDAIKLLYEALSPADKPEPMANGYDTPNNIDI